MKKLGNVLWGVIIIAIGVVIGLNALGLTNINIFFDGWWTLFIIIPSFIGLVKEEDKTASLIFLIVGIVLLLCAQDILSFRIIGKLIFPFILIMVGASLIFKDTINKKVSDKIKGLNSNKNNFEEYCAVFSSQKVDLNGQEFKGANVDAVFGSVDVDLESSTITKDQIINANAIFGGINIKVPQNVNIKIKSTPIFGGVSNKVKTKYEENLPTIYINSVALFGGVDIK